MVVTGCATTEGTYRNALKNDKAGIIYGMASDGSVDKNTAHKNEMCNKLHLTDSRCTDDNYILLPVISEFGFAKGWTGGFGFAVGIMTYRDQSKRSNVTSDYDPS